MFGFLKHKKKHDTKDRGVTVEIDDSEWERETD